MLHQRATRGTTSRHCRNTLVPSHVSLSFAAASLELECSTRRTVVESSLFVRIDYTLFLLVDCVRVRIGRTLLTSRIRCDSCVAESETAPGCLCNCTEAPASALHLRKLWMSWCALLFPLSSEFFEPFASATGHGWHDKPVHGAEGPCAGMAGACVPVLTRVSLFSPSVRQGDA